MATDNRDIDHLLAGAVDTHMHTAPDAFDRHDTDFSAARTARDHGMDAILIKSHHFETGARAQTATAETGLTVLGGITLNKWVGGLNPDAVDGAARLGASVVWMPTITAANHVAHGSIPHLDTETPRGADAGISVLGEGGLVDDALAVLDAIAANDLVLALGHLSPTEGIALTDAATDRDIRDVLCIHPHADFLAYTHDQLNTLVDLGATIELHYGMTTSMMDHAATIDDLAAAATAVGPEHVIMATDGGSTLIPPAIELYQAFIRGMLDAGIPEPAVRQMTHDNPKRVYELD